MSMNPVETKHMSVEATRLAKVLGNPKRLDALRLAIAGGQPISPKELCEEMPEALSLSNVAYHVRVLADHNLLTLVCTAQVRGSTKHFYVPNPTVLDTPVVQEILAAPRETATTRA